jgi:hypothetical protein
MSGQRKRITLDIHHRGPVPAPDHFLRSRTKRGGRFYLVEEVRQVRRKDPAAHPRYVLTVFEVDAETWAKRDPEQGTHFFNWYPRKPKSA